MARHLRPAPDHADEGRSFYTPFIADPKTPGPGFTGLEHVWRTDDNGGDPAYLAAHCNALHPDPGRSACGDWTPIGARPLTDASFGDPGRPLRRGDDASAEGDEGTLWAGTRVGRVFVTNNAADARSRDVRFAAPR